MDTSPSLGGNCFDIFRTITMFTTDYSARRLRLFDFVVNMASMDANKAKVPLATGISCGLVAFGRGFLCIGSFGTLRVDAMPAGHHWASEIALYLIHCDFWRCGGSQ